MHFKHMIAIQLACACLTAGAAPAANSSTIVNPGDVTREIEIVEDNKRRRERLAPSAMLEGVCLNGCLVRLVGVEDGEYVLEGNERVSIEDGLLYHDGPVVTGDEVTGDEVTGEEADEATPPQ